MTDCCIAVCKNHAVVAVTFAHQTRAIPYCHWHAYRPRGDLRWDLSMVSHIEHLEGS